MAATGAPRYEPARLIGLSASTDAVVSGPGRTLLRRGSDVFGMNEREARSLALGWLAYERARRPEAFAALLAQLGADQPSS